MASYKDHFSSTAEAYAVHRPRYPGELVRWLAGVCAQRVRAWDAGCGNGQLGVLLAGEFAEVIATDASRAQIAHAAAHPHVTYRMAAAEADFAQGGIADASIDLCVAAQAAHWFDMEGYVEQVRRVSKPGGVAALVSYGLMEIAAPPVQQEIRAFYVGDLAPFWPPERRHVENAYCDLHWPFEPLISPEFAIVRHWSCDELLGYIDTWSAISAMKKAGLQAGVGRFCKAVTAAWPETAATLSVRFPLNVRAARVN